MFSSKSISFFFCLMISVFATAQQPTIKILESGKKISIRGLSVVNDNVIWASGSGGNVARSIDGGNTWIWMVVPGYEKRDFRDIEAFDAKTAVIIAVAEPAIILRTTNGGASWKKVFEDNTKGVFLDAMDFNPKNGLGIAIGDPLEGTNQVYELITRNWGKKWEKRSINLNQYPKQATLEGEAFFASSGTNISMRGRGNHPLIVSGGKSSRLQHFGWTPLPIMQGKESTGANSIATHSSGNLAVVVGGDFTKDSISSNNCVLVDLRDWNAGIKFTQPETPPHGYRSCVTYLTDEELLTCGTSGIDISKDGGMNWELISKESFHVCQKAKKGKAVFLAGGGGRIAKLVYP
jgi:hypothetical protein